MGEVISEEKKRNGNIDLMKTVATFLVCYSHFNSFSTFEVDDWFRPAGILGYVMLTIAAYAVPLFLLINGYLVIHKEYSLEQYIKKAGHVIIITFLWGIIYNLVFGIAFHEKNAGIDIIRRIYRGVYQGEYISIRNWFFWTLGIIYIFLPLISAIFKKEDIKLIRYLFWTVFAFTMGSDLLEKVFAVITAYSGVNIMEFATLFPRINIFSSWDAFALVYFICGGILYEYRWKNSQKRNIYGKLAGISLCFMGMMVYGLWYMRTYKTYYNVVWSSYSNVLMLISACTIFCIFIERKDIFTKHFSKIVLKISQDSMGIYFVHLLVGTLLKPLYLSLACREHLLVGIGFAIIVFSISYVLCEAVKRVPLLGYMVIL